QKANVNPPNLDASTIADCARLPRRGVVYWIAPSPARAHVIWAGTDDGLIWLTRDEGAHWKNVSIPGLGPWSKIGIIDASHFDAQSAYAAVDRHRLDDNRPYVYKTHDGGAHWTAIAGGIPSGEWINVVREDPKRRGLLYAGGEHHVYVSFNDGGNWQSLQLNLPTASMRDITFNGDDVILGTHGRGIWILDNASPLRQTTAAVAKSTAHLFAPAVAYRTRAGSDDGTPLPPDEYALPNPQTGAALDYYLASGSGRVRLEIADASGRTVRQWSSSDPPVTIDPKLVDIPAFWLQPQLPPPSTPGAHRFYWDLHYAGMTGARRRRGGNGPLAPPGHYLVRLTAGGRTYTQALQLRRDPTYPATDADLRAQFALTVAIENEAARVRTAATRVAALLKSRPSLQALAGTAPVSSPDDSVGTPAQDFGSLRFIADALANLEGAVQSGDARPTADMYAAFARLRVKAARAFAQVNGSK
ncbi:MAG: hypothetical protein ABR508_07580, partial [Candidatus Baltobacteraceae bacterium]